MGCGDVFNSVLLLLQVRVHSALCVSSAISCTAIAPPVNVCAGPGVGDGGRGPGHPHEQLLPGEGGHIA